MNFELTEEHLMIQQAARDFAQTELLPGVIERDDKQIVASEQVKKLGEDAKIAVRNARRDQNDLVKKAEKAKEITEDDLKKFTDEIQKITDKFIKNIDDVISTKEKELLTV